jgi:predicted flap endonuclease-1-like 5' DNA nuclease
MPNIVDIEGIGKTYAAKLKEAGIVTTDKLLEAAATKKGRDQLAEKTGIAQKLVLEWVNLADLYRVKGIGSEYSDLLEEAGVDTVVELATRKPENLYAKIVEVNTAKKLVRKVPTEAAVKDWVEQAKKLPRKVEY